MEMIDIITRLRQQQQGMLRKGEFAFINRSDIVELLTMVDALRAERDEARRMVCASRSLAGAFEILPSSIAKDLGWDCFKENTNA